MQVQKRDRASARRTMRKRKRSDSAQWQKPLHPNKNTKSNVTTQKRHQNFDYKSIMDRLRTVSWSPLLEYRSRCKWPMETSSNWVKGQIRYIRSSSVTGKPNWCPVINGSVTAYGHHPESRVTFRRVVFILFYMILVPTIHLTYRRSRAILDISLSENITGKLCHPQNKTCVSVEDHENVVD